MEQRPLFYLVLLGIISWNVLQVVAYDQNVSCNTTQFLNEELNICCSRCPPGYYRKEKCTHETDTKCMLCPNGTFASKWNSAPSCRTCYPCSPHLVEKTPCSPTKATVCVCPDGYSCTQSDGLGVCQICTPDEVVTTVSTATEPGPPGVETPGTDIIAIWIIIGVGLFVVTVVVVVLCLRTSLLKRFGRMIKSKNCSDSSPQSETTVTVQFDGAAGPGFPLLKQRTTIKMPMQEQGKDLNYPIQETSKEIGEITLITNRVE